jgi:hypothetical protein
MVRRLTLLPPIGSKLRQRVGTACASGGHATDAAAHAQPETRDVAASAHAGKGAAAAVQVFVAMFIERVQRDFSSAKIKHNDMGSLLGEEMRCTDCSSYIVFV